MASRRPDPKERTKRPELAAALESARQERDDALLALAKERELTNALRLHLRQGEAAEVPRYPTGTGLGPTPLRYELADRLNATAKRALGPVHSAAKQLWSGKGKRK